MTQLRQWEAHEAEIKELRKAKHTISNKLGVLEAEFEGLKGIEKMIYEMHTDVKYMKAALEKKADKWVEKILWIGMVGTLGWLGGALLDLIPKAYALVAHHITLS